MMSANCSVVVTLSRVSRPCRTQCCSAKCLISTCSITQVPNALPCQCTQTRLPSNKQSWCIPGAHMHKQLPSKIHFHHCSTLLVSAFETNQPRTLLQASTNHQQSASVFRQGLPTIHHASQPFPSTVLGVEPTPDACLAFLGCSAKLVSHISCDPWSARHSPLPGTLPRNASRNGVS